MPNQFVFLHAIGISLQYVLLLALYVFLYKTIKTILLDLRHTECAAPGAVPERRQPHLLIVDSGSVSMPCEQIPLASSTAIGRSPHNHIEINDTFVSAEHACIAERQGQYWLTDLNSTNGTFLNGELVTGDVALQQGDVLKIGSVTFNFER